MTKNYNIHTNHLNIMHIFIKNGYICHVGFNKQHVTKTQLYTLLLKIKEKAHGLTWFCLIHHCWGKLFTYVWHVSNLYGVILKVFPNDLKLIIRCNIINALAYGSNTWHSSHSNMTYVYLLVLKTYWCNSHAYHIFDSAYILKTFP